MQRPQPRGDFTVLLLKPFSRIHSILFVSLVLSATVACNRPVEEGEGAFAAQVCNVVVPWNCGTGACVILVPVSESTPTPAARELL